MSAWADGRRRCARPAARRCCRQLSGCAARGARAGATAGAPSLKHHRRHHRLNRAAPPPPRSASISSSRARRQNSKLAARNSIDGRLVAAREHFDRGDRLSCCRLPEGARAKPGCRAPSNGCSIASRRSMCWRCARPTASRKRVSEPAAIDELLNAATFLSGPRRRRPRPKPLRPISNTRRATSASTLNAKVLSLRRALSGPASRLHPGRPRSRSALPADDPVASSRPRVCPWIWPMCR